ncbi:protein eva-1 homolog C isoform X2 [Adelges cooleyi]|uniref:protein eva-1 homolog C isoform X2 n=1 Tax=Adelges cooleyi TaxID=133065 RepID=UPI00217F5CF5|nr:protein eva-1 homolog C isoform X2 [Adelges cooleyi]
MCVRIQVQLLLLLFYRTIVADNLALLTGTLRTYHRVGCEAQSMALTCPTGTIISVQTAQYTPGSSVLPCTDSSFSHIFNSSCSWPQALQYSLLQTVVEACQKKQQCRVQPSVVGKYDPCPGHPKFVQVDYKCRPFEFRSKVACENEVVQLQCNPNFRLAIFSASYGRTEYESIQCPQPQGVPEETCLVSYATETVMTVCHGKRNCKLAADAATFGNPCKPASRMYLKVVYNCVPRRVLKEQFEEPAHSDEPTVMELDYFDNPGVAPVQPFESLSPPVNDPRTRYNKTSTGNIEYSNTSSSSLEKRETIYIYLGGALVGSIMSVLCVIAVKFGWQRSRRHIDSKHQSEASSRDLSNDPNAFGDNISEVDADIDLTDITQLPITVIPTQLQLSPSEVVRFGNDGVAPKSLSRNDSSQYFYG